ncbi:MAG: hypothetical protein KIS67_16400 [Verrucomicrobiae bacterium]|nr:hypothetical protein [Verrucomicrobiae bacterium]
MLTVLAPHRAQQIDEWTAERLESDTAIGLRFIRAGRQTTVAWRKADEGKATLAGLEFDQPMFMH